jgi:hypothetical protein
MKDKEHLLGRDPIEADVFWVVLESTDHLGCFNCRRDEGRTLIRVKLEFMVERDRT